MWRLREMISRLGALAGLDIMHVRSHPRHRLRRFLRDYGIQCVLDVGANTGQFGRSLREAYGFSGEIISFEPLPGAYQQLSVQAHGDRKWRVFNLAVGDRDTKLSLNVSKNSVSSSFLSMEPKHLHAAPNSYYIDKVEVEVRRLTSIPEVIAACQQACMLKIDTQGYEHAVLAGSETLLEGFSLILLELSLVTLYSGELPIEEMIAFLRSKGFDPISIHQAFTDPNNWHQLQADVLFANRAIRADLL